MTFLYPAFLWLLFPLSLFLWKNTRKIHEVIPLSILVLLVLSLARPVEKEALQHANIQGKDIIIALDVSYSMRAEDLSPTRYTFAKETIKALLEKNPSDNIMLIAFTSNPLLLSPPTTDHTLINMALQSLNPDYILTKGTSLKRLFTRITTLHTGHTNLILMSDGGEESELLALSTLLTNANISLSILALGSTKGSTIKNKDGSLLKDKQGNLIISRINPLLKDLASSVGGNYLTASASAKATAENISNALRKNQQDMQMIQKMQHHYVERYQFPLLFALLLFFMLHTRALKYLLLLFALLGLPLQASFFDDYQLQKSYYHYKDNDYSIALIHLKKIKKHSLQSQMALGNTYYKISHYKQAIKTYLGIHSTSTQTKQKLYYNIATAYVKLKAYDKAKIYYTKTLQLGEDADARYNLAHIMFLKNKKNASLGIAHPKSQSSKSRTSESTPKEKDDTRKEDQPSSGSGGGGENRAKEKKQRDKSKLISNKIQEKQPLSSKVYELINKGYIHETRPW